MNGNHITPLAEVLLETIQAAGGQWLTRPEIAERIGRKRLVPHDFELLNRLTEKGLIETEKTGKVVLNYYRYRAKIR